MEKKLLKRLEDMNENERDKLRELLKDSKSADATQKLNWMYKDKPDAEEYLLGRRIEKALIVEPEPTNSAAPGAVFNEVISRRSELDMQVKMREDPLYMIRKREEEAKRKLLENPVKMKELQKMIDQKKQLDESKAKKKKKKKKHKKHGSSASSSDDSDDELLRKYLSIVEQKKKQSQHVSIDSNRSRDSTAGTHRHSQSDRHNQSESRDKNHSAISHSAKRSYDRDRGHIDRRSEDRDRSHSDVRRGAKRSEDRDRGHINTKRFDDKDRSHSESRYETKRSEYEREPTDSRSDKKRFKDDDKRVSNSRQDKKREDEERVKGSHDESYDHQSSRKRKASRDSQESRSRSRSGSPEVRRPQGYGLIKRGNHESKSSHVKQSVAAAATSTRLSPPAPQKHQPKPAPAVKRKLTAEEIEKRRAEMMLNALERDEQRQRNIEQYKVEDEMENKRAEKQLESHDKDFVKPLMMKHAEQSSVEDRVKRNVYKIQRTGADLGRNFARR